MRRKIQGIQIEVFLLNKLFALHYEEQYIIEHYDTCHTINFIFKLLYGHNIVYRTIQAEQNK